MDHVRRSARRRAPGSRDSNMVDVAERPRNAGLVVPRVGGTHAGCAPMKVQHVAVEQRHHGVIGLAKCARPARRSPARTPGRASPGEEADIDLQHVDGRRLMFDPFAVFAVAPRQLLGARAQFTQRGGTGDAAITACSANASTTAISAGVEPTRRHLPSTMLPTTAAWLVQQRHAEQGLRAQSAHHIARALAVGQAGLPSGPNMDDATAQRDAPMDRVGVRYPGPIQVAGVRQLARFVAVTRLHVQQRTVMFGHARPRCTHTIFSALCRAISSKTGWGSSGEAEIVFKPRRRGRPSERQESCSGPRAPSPP